MTLFGSLLASSTKGKTSSSVIDEDLAKMQIEAQSRHEGVENMRESAMALSTLLGTVCIRYWKFLTTNPASV